MERLPHGFTNKTTSEDDVVTKTYIGHGADDRFRTEVECLRALADILPVPPLLYAAERRLSLTRMSGVHGKDLIEVAECVVPSMVAMAQTLLLIHGTPVNLIELPGTGNTLIHGDYGPQNLLFSPSPDHVVGVLDWEWAHLGEPIEDLATVEWIVRTHHEEAREHLLAFFDAYGTRPAWEDRKATMLERCRRFERTDPVDRSGLGRRLWWQERARIVGSWVELPGE